MSGGRKRNIGITVSEEIADAVYRAVKREGLSGGASAFGRRAVLRDLGAYTEELGALREYDNIEIEIPPGPMARFALLLPQMEAHEWDGCAECRAFIVTHAPGLAVSTDTFVCHEDGLERIREELP